MLATPIGNLEDLSPRARRVLGQVEVIAAESLKRTKALLAHLGLRGKRLVSCREANRVRAAQRIIEALSSGADVALVTDGGTPGVSDPGGWVVGRVVEAGYQVTPVPGPSALSAALSIAGIEGGPVVFAGFLPSRKGPRRRRLEELGASGWAIVIFEAPHRLKDSAVDIHQILGDGRKVVVARELTKLHEEIIYTTTAGLREMAGRVDGWQGEITLVVGPGPRQSPAVVGARELVRALSSAGIEPSKAARILAAATGKSRSEAYRMITGSGDDARN